MTSVQFQKLLAYGPWIVFALSVPRLPFQRSHNAIDKLSEPYAK